MPATSLSYEDIMQKEILDVYLDKMTVNIRKYLLKDAIGKGDKRPIAFGVRLWKKAAEGDGYDLVDIESADVQFEFWFTRGDGKSKNITHQLVEDYGPGPLSPTSPLVDCYVYGVIDEACTSVAGPFKLAIVLKDAPTSIVERTIWIIEGCIAETNSATTF